MIIWIVVAYTHSLENTLRNLTKNAAWGRSFEVRYGCFQVTRNPEVKGVILRVILPPMIISDSTEKSNMFKDRYISNTKKE